MMTFSRFLQVRACSRTSILLTESDFTSYSALTGTKYQTSNFKGGFVWVRGLGIVFTMTGGVGLGGDMAEEVTCGLGSGNFLIAGQIRRQKKNAQLAFSFSPFHSPQDSRKPIAWCYHIQGDSFYSVNIPWKWPERQTYKCVS